MAERAGADLRAVFEADSTTMAERKQLLRTVLSEVTVTVDTRHQGGQAGDPLRRRRLPSSGPCRHHDPGGTIPATDENTIELVRRLARHYNDTEIARILSRQGRHTAKGLRFTRERVNALRQGRGIPAAPPARTRNPDDAQIMSLSEAIRDLAVSDGTLYRWLRQGFIDGIQLTPGGPWHIRVDDELRAKIVPEIPPGWVTLKQAATILGVARQTVLDRVRRDELQAVHVKRGQRSGLAIDIGSAQHNQRDRLFN